MKVSVVIPTYNRFNCLLNAIESVKNQNYPDIEIIVVNDRSTQKEYYEYDFPGVTIVHLDKGAIERHGRPMPGCYPRNVGMKIASGDYVAFLDDDDSWTPYKIRLQIETMKDLGHQMSCSDGYIGSGPYDENKTYQKYNKEYYWGAIVKIFKKKKRIDLIKNGFPQVWNLDFLNVHNCCVTSSVVLAKEIIDKVGEFKIMSFAEDYDYWRRALQYTNCAYVDAPLFYYDGSHGGGRKY